MHLLNQLCVVACFVVAQKGFSNQYEHFPLLSSEYFVEFINIYNISGQDRSLEYQAGGNNGTYAVIGAVDWTCRKDERRCQKDFWGEAEKTKLGWN